MYVSGWFLVYFGIFIFSKILPIRKLRPFFVAYLAVRKGECASTGIVADESG